MVTNKQLFKAIDKKDRDFVLVNINDTPIDSINSENLYEVFNNLINWDSLNESDYLRMKDIYQSLVPDGKDIEEEIKPENTKQVYTDLEPKNDYDFINPNHYKKGSKEVYEMMIDVFGIEAYKKFCEMNAFKYRMRLGNKPGEDVQRELDKIKWYEDKMNG